MKESDLIKLASNENSFGPSKKTIKAAKDALKQMHIYPDGSYFDLKQEIAKKFGLEMDNVSLGNGSNELIELIGHALLSEGDEVVVSQYCFAIYTIVAKLFKATPVIVHAKNYGHNLSAMASAITPRTKIVFVANPNNPTGTLATKEEVEEFLSKVPSNVLIVMDEAYSEYVTNPIDLFGKIKDNSTPNLCILRTFSKMYGLAGLRVGYALANKDFIAALEKVRQPFNINLISQKAALAALKDLAHVKKIKKENVKGIKFLEKSFKLMNLEFVPSSANFVLVKVGDGAKVFLDLQKEGVIVRPVGGYGLPEWIRVTSGTAKENKKFINALKKVLSKN
jgi:histidinol-phosphate aminotransferase